MSIVYGPVPSWRLGRSLGVDPVSTEKKTCNFNCIYCQLGQTRLPARERKVFVKPEELARELKNVGEIELDYITFSGVAEPTLAANLSELVEVVRAVLPGCPLAILTNSAFISREDVRRDLALFDTVVAKMDAPDEELFRKINRPVVRVSLAEIVEGIRIFRKSFRGKLALQMMFISANKERAWEMAEIARKLSPDEIQLNTPLRPSPVPPLSPEEMEEIEAAFSGLPILNIYKAERPKVLPLDEEDTKRRRPVREIGR
ncbi:MAG: radical SAM protein [Anaerolineae bacterium]